MQEVEFMARKRGRPRKDAGGSTSLIDWQEPESNAHVLDWRERAHEFGLMPIGDSDEGEHVVLPPDRLIDEDDVEAPFVVRPLTDRAVLVVVLLGAGR